MARPPRHVAPVPVLCVGNPTVGGAGKTPTAIRLAAILAERGLAPAFLTRGYRGRLAGPLVVDPARHGAAEVGDEALLLARVAPTIVAADRVAGARLAVREGADAIVMDDGFQNPALAKDWTCLVVDAAVGLGNGLVLPAGPLRARAAPQFARADALVVMDGGDARGRADGGGPAPRRPDPLAAVPPAARPPLVAHARLAPRPAPGLAGRRVLAFAGIGRPEKFFATCRALGMEVERTRAFADHHAFSEADARALLAICERDSLVPVTTAKDRVRLSAGGTAEDPRGRLAVVVGVVEVTAEFEAEAAAALDASVEAALDRRAARGG